LSTVLIASAEHLGPMKASTEYQDALAFADSDALRALEAITRQRPQLVVLESLFAASARGTALLNRIKADPALRDSEVRIVEYRSVQSELPPPLPEAPPPTEEPVAPASEPLDSSGTRWAPRFEIIDGVELLVDGNPATLVDLSTSGAQVLSQTSLRPNQRVRLTLPGAFRPIRLVGAITWAVFEMPQGAPSYRAGVAFFDPDAAGIQRFIDSNKK
jgi:hypothetical protein